MAEPITEQPSNERRSWFEKSLLVDDSVQLLAADRMFLGAMLCALGYVVVLIMDVW
jgi:hypothetical protein